MAASIQLEWCLVGAMSAVGLSAAPSANENPLVANIVRSSVRDADEFIDCGAVILRQFDAELASLYPEPMNLVQVGRDAYPNAHQAATSLVKRFRRISRRWARIEPAGTDLSPIETNWKEVARGLRMAFMPEERTRVDASNLGTLLGRERRALLAFSFGKKTTSCC